MNGTSEKIPGGTERYRVTPVILDHDHAANTFISVINDRMPVILGRSDEEAWLDPEIRGHAAADLEVQPEFLVNRY